MPPFETLLPFVLGILILQLSPGPDMLLILDRAIVHGWKVAFSTIAGIVFVAGAIQIGMLVFGLGTLIQHHPSVTVTVQFAGAAYLLYLGLKMMATRQLVLDPATPGSGSLGLALWDGTLSSILNPKTVLFLVAFLPQFVDPDAGPVWMQMLVLGTLHKLASLMTLGSVAFAAGLVGDWTRKRPGFLPIQRKFCGMLMVAISLAMAIGAASWRK